ncbi:hypothetical protein PMIN04_002629 [Paraphaeosphaeria minitans]
MNFPPRTPLSEIDYSERRKLCFDCHVQEERWNLHTMRALRSPSATSQHPRLCNHNNNTNVSFLLYAPTARKCNIQPTTPAFCRSTCRDWEYALRKRLQSVERTSLLMTPLGKGMPRGRQDCRRARGHANYDSDHTGDEKHPTRADAV